MNPALLRFAPKEVRAFQAMHPDMFAAMYNSAVIDGHFHAKTALARACNNYICSPSRFARLLPYSVNVFALAAEGFSRFMAALPKATELAIGELNAAEGALDAGREQRLSATKQFLERTVPLQAGRQFISDCSLERLLPASESAGFATIRAQAVTYLEEKFRLSHVETLQNVATLPTAGR